MSHPTIMNANGNLRYNQLLQEAETERQYRRSNPDRPGLRERSGALLVRLGERLKAEPQSPAYRMR